MNWVALSLCFRSNSKGLFDSLFGLQRKVPTKSRLPSDFEHRLHISLDLSPEEEEELKKLCARYLVLVLLGFKFYLFRRRVCCCISPNINCVKHWCCQAFGSNSPKTPCTSPNMICDWRTKLDDTRQKYIWTLTTLGATVQVIMLVKVEVWERYRVTRTLWRALGPVSRKPRNFSGVFRVT